MSYSRDPFCCFSNGQDLATFFDCRRQAFAHFGGVPMSTVLDRTKTVVRRQATVGPLSAAIGVHTTLLGAAVVILGCIVAMLAVRDVRALRIRTASPATGPSHRTQHDRAHRVDVTSPRCPAARRGQSTHRHDAGAYRHHQRPRSSAQHVIRVVGGEDDVHNGQPAATVKTAVRSSDQGDRHPAWKRILSSLTCCD